MARLTTDNALWPSARVKVTHTASAANAAAWLMAHTTTPSASDNDVSTVRLP